MYFILPSLPSHYHKSNVLSPVSFGGSEERLGDTCSRFCVDDRCFSEYFCNLSNSYFDEFGLYLSRRNSKRLTSIFKAMARFFRLKLKNDPEFIKREEFAKVIDYLYHQPENAWSILEVSQVVKTVAPIDLSIPKLPGHTRFVCISDTHSLRNFTHPIPDGDVLIHAGDFTMAGRMEEIRQFNEFMTSQRYSHKVVIAGNHDIVFDDENSESLYPYWRGSVGGKLGAKEAKELLEDAKCTYLQDSEVTINGIRIYGSPWYDND